MSFWVYLNDQGNTVTVESFEEGGTYTLGGSEEASLNITYNYSRHYYQHLNTDFGLRWLDGKKASETLEALKNAIDILGIEQDADYWAGTPGNAGYALSILYKWAQQYPNAIWTVS